MTPTLRNGRLRGIARGSIGWMITALLLLAGSQAHARVATLRWQDPNAAPSPVVGFRLHVGTSPGVYGAIVELGLPAPEGNGLYSASADIPDGVDVYFAMSSYDVNGLESDLSNERMSAAPPPPDEMPNGQIDQPSGPVTITAGDSVFFSGSGSDPDGGSVTYAWSFDAAASGVGNSSQRAPGAVTFPKAGTFLVSLTVRDDEGNLDPSPATVVVTVQAPPPPPPAPAPPPVEPPEPPPAPTPPPVEPPPAPAPPPVEPPAPPPAPAPPPSVEPPPSDPPAPNAGFTGLREMGRVTGDSVVATAPDGDTRLFVAARSGLIRIVEGGYPRTAPFLDLSASVSGGVETGLRGLAFDPDYASNGYFFVFRVDERGDAVVSRFRRGAHPYAADRQSETEILRVALPYGGNPGGGLAFGPDGFLFVGLGDGGGEGDPDDHAQDRSSLLGKVLRLDVGVPARANSLPAGAYAIPADNPFVSAGGTRSEIWALGLRNPSRMAVDPQNGGLWIADRGAGLSEEVNYESGSDSGGHNYGWDVAEGTFCNPTDPAPSPSCDDNGLTDPLFEYDTLTEGCGIVGGFVHRGVHSEVRSDYFFADGCSGNVFTYERSRDRLTNRTIQFLEDGVGGLIATGMGQGGTGEIYVLGSDGRIFEVQSDQPSCSDGMDNDGDGLADYPEDPGCASPDSEFENPLCNDGFDNDLDGNADLDDPQCSAASANVETNPFQIDEIDGEELFCGLGAELVFIIPAFMWLRRAGSRLRGAPVRA